MKKLTIQDEKSKSRIESLETSLKALNDRQEINENDLRVGKMKSLIVMRDLRT